MELLLAHEERVWQPGTPHSWEAIDPVSATYTPDITPLTLAAYLARMDMFFHIASVEREVYWQVN